MRFYTIAAVVAALATPAVANDFAPAMTDFLEAEVRQWAQDPILVAAITAQNTRHSGLGLADIEALDQTWRAEVGSADSATVNQVLQNSAADFLRERIEDSAGVITELFIMDEHGLNVAASAPTSDMWQGDEAKFQKTYGVGSDAVHLSEIEFDESSQTYQGQISIPVVDPATGALIGAMTIGVNAEALM